MGENIFGQSYSKELLKTFQKLIKFVMVHLALGPPGDPRGSLRAKNGPKMVKMSNILYFFLFCSIRLIHWLISHCHLVLGDKFRWIWGIGTPRGPQKSPEDSKIAKKRKEISEVLLFVL